MPRRAPKPERGQAMLLAVVGLVVLAIGMYTSYNLSRAVYEKVQLQTAADATAYSIATMEARTFNFISFTNRAQVANYVQMMEAQSLLSSASFTEGYVGWGGDVSQAVAKLLKAIPGMGAIASALEAIGKVLEGALPLLTAQVDVMDEFTPRYIQLMTSKNQALFGVSAMLALATATQVATGMPEVVEANDSDARVPDLAKLINIANVASYAWAFDTASLSPKGSGDGAKKARRLMTELANASRFGSSAAGGFERDFIVSREPFESLSSLLGGLVGAGEEGGGIVDKIIGDFLGPIGAPRFVGTTKLLTEAGGKADLADTGRHRADRSDLALGDAIAAKDQARAFKWGEFASVISGVKAGQHCRYEKPDNYGSPLRLPALLKGSDFKCNDSAHNKEHVWKALIGKGGIQPYMKFAAHRGGFSLESKSFNQPDVWIWLNKPSERMALAGRADLQIELSDANGRAKLDSSIDGMNVLARAQVYYHRPGAWQEPPNFFNPYWGARLAPKGVALDRLLDAVPLPAAVANYLSDNILMH